MAERIRNLQFLDIHDRRQVCPEQAKRGIHRGPIDARRQCETIVL
jgi:hypothetical protein